MDLLVFIPVWRRPRITELCYIALQRLIAAAPDSFSFKVLIVLSEENHIDLAEKYGWDWVMVPNTPVGAKFNAGLEYALAEYEFDYLFQLNSDNLISNDFWGYFAPWLEEKRWAAMGVDRVYFYDSSTGTILSFRYFGGCGIRFLSKETINKSGWRRWVRFKSTRAGMDWSEFMNKLGWVPDNRFDKRYHEWDGKTRRFELWPPDIGQGLDTASISRIYVADKSAYPLRIPRHDTPLVVDIKGPINIHPFSEFHSLYQVGTDVEHIVTKDAPRQQIVDQFPELQEIEKMLKIGL